MLIALAGIEKFVELVTRATDSHSQGGIVVGCVSSAVGGAVGILVGCVSRTVGGAVGIFEGWVPGTVGRGVGILVG
jgi:hypothetical protein